MSLNPDLKFGLFEMAVKAPSKRNLPFVERRRFALNNVVTGNQKCRVMIEGRTPPIIDLLAKS